MDTKKIIRGVFLVDKAIEELLFLFRIIQTPSEVGATSRLNISVHYASEDGGRRWSSQWFLAGAKHMTL